MDQVVTADQRQDTRQELVGLSREELRDALGALGEKPFRAKQLWHWIYHRGARDFAAMTDLAKPLRAKLEENFVVGRPTIAREQTSVDRSRKWLMQFADGQKIIRLEKVVLPGGKELSVYGR